MFLDRFFPPEADPELVVQCDYCDRELTEDEMLDDDFDHCMPDCRECREIYRGEDEEECQT